MPAVIHESIAFLTSSRGGSSIPTYPRGERNTKEKGYYLLEQKCKYWKSRRKPKKYSLETQI